MSTATPGHTQLPDYGSGPSGADPMPPPRPPDHTQLPETDGTFVTNFQEHPQGRLLIDSLESVLRRIHPDGQYVIALDCGIYWWNTDPPLRGTKAPDWFYVPGASPTIEGRPRRSYVLWN